MVSTDGAAVAATHVLDLGQQKIIKGQQKVVMVHQWH
jgi:hypothetical protein